MKISRAQVQEKNTSTTPKIRNIKKTKLQKAPTNQKTSSDKDKAATTSAQLVLNTKGTRDTPTRTKKLEEVDTTTRKLTKQKPSIPKVPVNFAVPKGRSEASSNWELLQSQLNADGKKHWRRYRRPQPYTKDKESGPTKMLKNTTNTNPVIPPAPKPKAMIQGFPTYDHTGKVIIPSDPNLIPPIHRKPTWCLAMDCEMVGVGPMKESALARVSIVNEHGFCLYDKFVKPKVKITDYRTEVSGIREEDMKNAENFDIAIQEVSDLLRGHVIVGHAIHHDFKVLLIRHSKSKIRDTSVYFRPVFKRTPSLKGLAEKLLHLEIQTGEHNSIVDAQVTMKLYLNHRKEWEEQILANKSRAKNHGRPTGTK